MVLTFDRDQGSSRGGCTGSYFSSGPCLTWLMENELLGPFEAGSIGFGEILECGPFLQQGEGTGF